MAHFHTRKGYEGLAVAVPVTVPYERYSTRGAHWFLGQALHALLQQSGLEKAQIDGLTVSSFSLVPDTAVGVTQGLSLTTAALEAGFTDSAHFSRTFRSILGMPPSAMLNPRGRMRMYAG